MARLAFVLSFGVRPMTEFSELTVDHSLESSPKTSVASRLCDEAIRITRENPIPVALTVAAAALGAGILGARALPRLIGASEESASAVSSGMFGEPGAFREFLTFGKSGESAAENLVSSGVPITEETRRAAG